MIQSIENIISTAIVCLLFVTVGWAQPHSDKSVTGVVSGFDCAVVEVLCPTTHRGADYTNGLFTEEKEFYFVVNIPQSFLRQYFRETFEVEGAMYEPYTRALEPETIYLIKDDDRKVVYESGYFIDEEGRKATFQDGIYMNGKWTVEQTN